MHAPLPHGFYGNAMHFSSVMAELKAGVGNVAERIGAHVAGLEEEEYWSAIEWVEEEMMMMMKKKKVEFPVYGPELTCVNLEHVFGYGAVFDEGEKGKPVHVSCRIGGVVGEGVVVVLPAPEEGMGRTVVISLREDLTERICRDEVIAKYEPVLMFH